MSLGDFVRISKAFTEAFKWAAADDPEKSLILSGDDREDQVSISERSEWINQLRQDLKVQYKYLFEVKTVRH